MPIYEFRCSSCEHRFEVMQRIDDPAPSCERCGGTVEKLVSAPAFQFKGSGWYVTDYARKKDEKSDGAGKEKAGDGEGGGGDKGGKDKGGKEESAGAKEPAKKDSGGESGKAAGSGDS